MLVFLSQPITLVLSLLQLPLQLVDLSIPLLQLPSQVLVFVAFHCSLSWHEIVKIPAFSR